MKKILLAWSSGKDSAWSPHVLRQQGLEPAALLTTLNEAADRVAMHGVRRSVLEAQAEAAGLPLWQVPLLWPCTNDDYEARKVLDSRFAGREFDDTLLADLPASIDPCGENGEFHTCVYAGPMFSRPIAIELGEIRDVNGFIYADLAERQCQESSL